MDGGGENTQLKEAMTAVIDPMCSTGNGCNTSVAPGGEFIAGGTGSADSCFGDSGGPVYLETSRGPIVIGAVSRGVNNSATACGGGGIYVRTDKIAQWIDQTAGKVIAKDDCAASTGGDGTGSGTGSGGGGTGGEGDDLDRIGNVSGGCSAGGSSTGSISFVLGALGVGLVIGRRRRGECSAKPAEAKPADDPPPYR
jgi:MYXO-CTERM domain-containing protein